VVQPKGKNITGESGRDGSSDIYILKKIVYRKGKN
jgi:hypothetical protein